MTELTINGTRYRLGNNHYAEYYHKGTWRVSASISNGKLTELMKDDKQWD